jgi:hypothetical protein
MNDNRTPAGRLRKLETLWQAPRTCQTCYGARYALIFVPEGEDHAAPEYTPTHCPGCGLPLVATQQIIGISEEEMFP